MDDRRVSGTAARRAACAIGLAVALMGCAESHGLGAERADAALADAGFALADARSTSVTDAGPRLECPSPGPHHEQILEIDGEPRAYFLYVPSSIDCARPVALWVDFHGTAGDRPEEAYGLAAQIALADREGFVLVRPRSRYAGDPTFGRIYRWDQNPGDLDRNVRLVEALIAHLGRALEIDPERLYASGFSSGSNMTARLLGETTLRFTGFGPIAGGIFAPGYPLRALAGESFRVYASTGFRDYLHPQQRELLAALRERGVDEDRVLVREADTGHELYDEHFEEMWRFFEDGARPAPGTLAPGWAREHSGTERSLLDLERAPDGALLAVGESGTIVRRAPDGTWSPVPGTGTTITWTDACFTGDGRALVVGEGRMAVGTDLELTLRPGRLPELGAPTFGYGYIDAIACGPAGRAVMGGFWSALRSDDAGATFSDLEIDFGGYRGQIAALSFGASEHVAVGYAGLAVGTGSSLSYVPPPGEGGWILDAHETASGALLVVDDAGGVFRSVDRRSFERVASAGRPLYAIGSQGTEVLAVGARGAALHSLDDGRTFVPIETGLDAFLGGVRFVAPGAAIAVGEDGLALRFTAHP